MAMDNNELQKDNEYLVKTLSLLCKLITTREEKLIAVKEKDFTAITALRIKEVLLLKEFPDEEIVNALAVKYKIEF
jgi:hypothetical protein